MCTCLYTNDWPERKLSFKKAQKPWAKGPTPQGENREFLKCWEPDEGSQTEEGTEWTSKRQRGRSKGKKTQGQGLWRIKLTVINGKKKASVISQTLCTIKPEMQTDPIMTRVTLWWQAPLISDEASMPVGAGGASKSSLRAIAGPKRLSKSSNGCPF